MGHQEDREAWSQPKLVLLGWAQIQEDQLVYLLPFVELMASSLLALKGYQSEEEWGLVAYKYSYFDIRA